MRRAHFGVLSARPGGLGRGGGSETGTNDFKPPPPPEDDAEEDVVEIDGEEDGHEDVESGDNGSGDGTPKRISVTGDAVVEDDVVVLDRSCGRAPEESGSRYGDVEHGVDSDVE
ncbi:hypothetical protein MTO96_010217 [Rhipicephalus appendiculatus]